MKQMRSFFIKLYVFPFLATVLCLIFTPPAFSENSALSQAVNHLNKGEYQEALQLFEQVPEPDRMAGLVGAASVRAAIGDYPEAERILRQLLSTAPEGDTVHILLADLLRRTGRSEEAIQVLKPIIGLHTATVCSMVQYGKLLGLRGRNVEAADYFQRAISDYDRGLVFDALEIACVADAFRLSGRFQDDNSLYREAARVDPKNSDIQVSWGDLFREKYNLAEARQSYQQVLEQNGRHVAALVGMAQVSDGPFARAILETALEINPHYAPARVVLAGLLVEDGNYDEAVNQLQMALAVNAESTDALTQWAAVAYLTDDRVTFQTLEKKVAGLNPNNGVFYTRIAEICGRNYRFVQAVAMAEKAVALDAGNWSGHIVLGMNLLRLGREEEGRRHLEIGFQGDPFHVWAMNMLTVLDTLDGYETRTTEHFIVRMHPMDAAVLWPYLKPLLEESWQKLTAKYGFSPSGPVLIEIFPEQEDFAVRTSGLPNIGHLLGVCFGNVITLSSPKTYTPPDLANWQEVVWHEFAHVITLHMSNNRIPRWLSEGVSVFEEGFGRPEWGRRQDIDLIRAVQANRLVGVGQLDAAFSKADTLADLNFAYYEASLLVEYIVERYGFDTLKTLIYRYTDNHSQDTIFETVFNSSTQDLDTAFFAWLKQRTQKVNVFIDSDLDMEATTPSDGTPGDGLPASQQQRKQLKEKLEKQVRDQPRDFMARLHLGLILYADKDYKGAIQHLTVARALLPDFSAKPNPREILAAIYEAQGDRASMIRELEGLARFQQTALDACFKLAEIAWDHKDYDRAVYYWERALAVNPYDATVHRRLGAAALQQADYSKAVREFEVLLALDQSDPALANTDLAEALLRSGNKSRAKHYALAALEVAPLFDRAQDILLDAIAP